MSTTFTQTSPKSFRRNKDLRCDLTKHRRLRWSTHTSLGKSQQQPFAASFWSRLSVSQFLSGTVVQNLAVYLRLSNGQTTPPLTWTVGQETYPTFQMSLKWTGLLMEPTSPVSLTWHLHLIPLVLRSMISKQFHHMTQTWNLSKKTTKIHCMTQKNEEKQQNKA